MPPVLLLLVGLTALERLHELRLSRQNLRLLQEQTERRGGVMWPGESRPWFGAMVLLQLALLTAPVLEAHLRPPTVSNLQTAAAVLLWGIGQGLRLWSQRSLGKTWNVRGIVSSTQEIVTDGPFRFLRHPNYLGVVLEMIALPLAGSAWISLVCLNLVHVPILRHRIRFEERLLSRHAAYSRLIGTKAP